MHLSIHVRILVFPDFGSFTCFRSVRFALRWIFRASALRSQISDLRSQLSDPSDPSPQPSAAKALRPQLPDLSSQASDPRAVRIPAFPDFGSLASFGSVPWLRKLCVFRFCSLTSEVLRLSGLIFQVASCLIPRSVTIPVFLDFGSFASFGSFP